MDSCIECGSSDVVPRVHDGATVFECGLCGSLAGAAAVVQAVVDERQAQAAGVDPSVWPLQRLIDALPGVRVAAQSNRIESVDRSGSANSVGLADSAGLADRARPAERAVPADPAIRWQALDARALAQLDNLAKSLQLAGRVLALRWRIEVEYRESLTFSLRAERPQPAGPPLHNGLGSAEHRERVRTDLETLARAIERNQRLSWWRTS